MTLMDWKAAARSIWFARIAILAIPAVVALGWALILTSGPWGTDTHFAASLVNVPLTQILASGSNLESPFQFLDATISCTVSRPIRVAITTPVTCSLEVKRNELSHKPRCAEGFAAGSRKLACGIHEC